MLTLSASLKGKAVHTNFEVTTTAAQIAGQNGNRKAIIFQNQGSVNVFISNSELVATSGSLRGHVMVSGSCFTDDATNGEWWAITASDSAIVHVTEVS